MNAEDRLLSESMYKLMNKLMNIETKLYKKRDKYPNLHKAWHTTIIFKIDKMIKMLDQCDNFCENVDNIVEKDIPVKTLALLYILNNKYLNK